MWGTVRDYDAPDYMVVHDIKDLKREWCPPYVAKETNHFPVRVKEEPVTPDSCFSLSINGDDEVPDFEHPIFDFDLIQNRLMNNCWSTKITEPKPFKLSHVDAKFHSKCKAMKRLEKEQKEAEEKRKFKARPAPPHTFFPLYTKMKENEKQQVQERREKVRERMLAIQKPFQFYFREEVKKRFRAKSAPNLTTMKMQSPTKQRAPLKYCKSMQNIAVTSTPKEKYENFNEYFNGQELIKHVSAKNLECLENIRRNPGHGSKVANSSYNGNDSDKSFEETIWPFPDHNMKRPESKFFFIPPKLNWAATLRFKESRQKESQPHENIQKPKDWKLNIRRHLKNKIAADLNKEFADRLLKKKLETKIRTLEYKNELKMMMMRLDERPLLMDGQTQMNPTKRS